LEKVNLSNSVPEDKIAYLTSNQTVFKTDTKHLSEIKTNIQHSEGLLSQVTIPSETVSHCSTNPQHLLVEQGYIYFNLLHQIFRF
jgi:hypothetical protein